MTVRFLDLRATHTTLRPELDAAAARVLDSGWFVLGEEVAAFEREWAQYVGAQHAIGVSNGLDALVLALLAVGVVPGDEVLVPSNTFIATWLAVSRVGATPVPVEPDARTFVVPSAAFVEAITARTRAVIPVHLYGLPADLDDLVAVARSRGIAVIEDAAQAHGAARVGKRVGSQGDLVCWSFYPGKNLGALGDAGAVTTNDAQLAERVRLLSNYGSPRKYEHVARGGNCRLDELQAAFLRAKLPTLDEFNRRRRQVARRYLEEIDTDHVILPSVPPGANHAWHLFVILCEQRDDLATHLARADIESSIHYPVPPHLQPAYASMTSSSYPVSEDIHRRCLSLPMGPHLLDADVEAVIAAVNGYRPANT